MTPILRRILFLFVPPSDSLLSSPTPLRGFLLTWHPSVALNVASYPGFETTEIQGHCGIVRVHNSGVTKCVTNFLTLSQ